MRCILFAIVMLITAPAQAGVYKCTQADGTVKYQGTPCVGGAAVKLDNVGHYNPVAAEQANKGFDDLTDQYKRRAKANKLRRQASAQAHIAKRADEKRIRHLMISHQVGPGMTPSQVRRAIGDPSRINSDSDLGGTREQWVYPQPNYGSNYVYFENGRVVGQQHY